jgi:hypothetical protein
VVHAERGALWSISFAGYSVCSPSCPYQKVMR